MPSGAGVQVAHNSFDNTNSTNLNDQEFPALPKHESSQATSKVDPLLPPSNSNITEIIEIPSDERRVLNTEEGLNSKRYQAQRKVFTSIARENGVEIHINTSKNNVLTVAITGEPMKVVKAKRSLTTELQTQRTSRISVPVEFHGFLIGRKGERLQEIESTTMTRITIPSSNAPNSDITITGTRKGIMEAEKIISEAVRKQAQFKFERISIPRIYYPFICGPNNQYINELKIVTDTKIIIPPSSSQSDEIVVSGKRDDVNKVVKDIQAIYQDKLQTTKTITVNIKRSQHRIVCGPRASSINDILAQTGVSVELPTDSVSEEITLRGKPEDLGRALSMVYELAQSSVTEKISAPSRFHRMFIGKKGSRLTELLEGYEQVQVEFKEKDNQIIVEGPPEQVEVVIARLKLRLSELEATMAQTTVKVDPKYFRHIIGKQGSKINRLRDYRVQIRMAAIERGDAFAPDLIVIEGDPDGVEKAKVEIQNLVEKLENEKCKDIIIEPRIQRLLCSGHNGTPPPIRIIYDSFPKVSVLWPANDGNALLEDDPSRSIVQFRGDRQQVDAAAERLTKLIKTVIEENYRQEIRIFKEFRSSLFGRGSVKIRKLLEDTKTRLQHPSPGEESDIFTVIGREENVIKAVRQLEEMQKQLANIKEVVVTIPSELTTKFAGGKARSLRSICEQCEGVHIRFLNTFKSSANQASENKTNLSKKLNHSEVMLLGPQEAVEKAENLIKDLNAKVSQLVAEEIIVVNPKYHGHLIGRHAVNITQFRRRHNVELIFPDRLECDQKLASEVRIVGPKLSVPEAKEELKSIVRSLEDEMEHSIAVNASLIKDIVQYRRTFNNPDLERVRIIMPRTIQGNKWKSAVNNDDGAVVENVNIKLIGSKAEVENAAKILQKTIEDIEAHVTKEFPLTDPNHITVLGRNRSQFFDLERSYQVYIRLLRPNEYNINGGDCVEKSGDDSNILGLLIITGLSESIERVYEEGIRPLLPIEEMFELEQEFHRSLIMQPNDAQQQQRLFRSKNKPLPSSDDTNGFESVSKAVQIRQKFFVNIRLPPQNATGSNFVFLRGTPSNVAAVKLELADWVKQCEAVRADRIARSFELTVDVPTKFIQSVLSYRLSLCEQYDVALRVNKMHQPQVNGVLAGDEGDHLVNGVDDGTDGNNNAVEQQPRQQMTELVVRGYEAKAVEMKKEIEKIVQKLSTQVTESLFIPVEAHSYLIGSRGSSIQKFIHDFKVRIEFPNKKFTNTDPNTVLVTGDPHDVDLACDFLINKANEIITRINVQKRSTGLKLVEEDIRISSINS